MNWNWLKVQQTLAICRVHFPKNPVKYKIAVREVKENGFRVTKDIRSMNTCKLVSNRQENICVGVCWDDIGGADWKCFRWLEDVHGGGGINYSFGLLPGL